jgi:[ribosomal protein S5]-alanine N-acetyltransferase
VILATELPDVRLRPWRGEDKAALLRHADNRKIWRNLADAFPHPYTADDADRWLALAAAAGAHVRLAIERRGEAVGGIGVDARQGEQRHTGHLGYWLGEAHWGEGVATAAVRALVTHLFDQDRFERLETVVFGWNPASMRVLEKSGFAREGILRRSVFKDGEFLDSVLYAALRGA